VIAGIVLLGRLLMGSDIAISRRVGMPTEENLKAMVADPELSPTFVISALHAATVWGAAHSLTPGHGKAIVGAYLVGARGTAWHALYLGLTVTVTQTLGVFVLGLVATLAAGHVEPETLYPWLGVLSGLIVLALGVVMPVSRIRQNTPANQKHLHHQAHSHLRDGQDEHDHSHLPPGADGSPVTWRSLLTLGISGGLLPCPSAMVLLLTAVALHRIGFGLALVVAFSVGLAGVLTVVGLLFIKGDRLYLIKLVIVLATGSGAGISSFPWPITLMIHAMFLPNTSMICLPSASCSISPGLRPWATFQ
jgi:ABC-type nickel/cobalt efflux system permease component RcnA